ncbi:MAG: AraC family transcriptional regulator [Cytophagales bacterium]|nr:MAG: AraC family transcriptional regulator [Cytophagales bacterium]
MTTLFTDFKKWFEPYKSWFFKYKNGFFEFYPLTSSPEELVNSFKKVPFFIHNSEKQIFSTSTPFLEAFLFYQNIENELFLTATETFYKYNLKNTQSYSEFSEPKYYNITLNIDYLYNQNKDEFHPNIYWIFYKPGAVIKTQYLKKSKGKYITFYFTYEWITNYLKSEQSDLLKIFEEFNQSFVQQIIIKEETQFSQKFVDNLFINLKDFDFKNIQNISNIKEQSIAILELFLKQFYVNFKNKSYLELNEKERVILIESEQYLNQILYEKFPGITFLASKVGCSETKIKTLFNQIHNISIFKYFQNLQMKRANELILYSNLKILEIAALFQYENVSKFSNTFKEFTGHLPRELRKTEKSN